MHGLPAPAELVSAMRGPLPAALRQAVQFHRQGAWRRESQ
jgi:hypothetical protein